MCAQLHFKICKETGLKLDTEHWYEYVQISVETSHQSKGTILRTQQVHTDRNIPNNKLNIIIHDDDKETGMLTDAAISGDRIVIKKEAEKVLKYKDRTIEMQCMWNVKTKVIPVVIVATGTISESFKQPYWSLHVYFGKY